MIPKLRQIHSLRCLYFQVNELLASADELEHLSILHLLELFKHSGVQGI